MFDVKKINPLYDRMKIKELNAQEDNIRREIRTIEAKHGVSFAVVNATVRPLYERLHEVIEARDVMAKVKCSVCGKGGYAVGDMYATENLQVVYCREHVPEGVLCIEVEGRIGVNDTPVPFDGGRGMVAWRYGEIILWAEPNYYGVNGQKVICGCYFYTCWVRGGSTSWVLTDEEKNRLAKGHIKQVMVEIATKRANGIWRCTGCGKEITKEQVAGYPLFAGCNCDECWERHKMKVEEERRTGKVCSMCGKPWSECYC